MRLLCLVLLLSGCATADRALVYSEDGLRAAEGAWDKYYNAKASECSEQFQPKTPEMEQCFGKTFDADAKVGVAVQSAVTLLRSYWVARAAGQKPDWKIVMQQVNEIVQDLPPDVREIFNRVKGIR